MLVASNALKEQFSIAKQAPIFEAKLCQMGSKEVTTKTVYSARLRFGKIELEEFEDLECPRFEKVFHPLIL